MQYEIASNIKHIQLDCNYNLLLSESILYFFQSTSTFDTIASNGSAGCNVNSWPVLYAY